MSGASLGEARDGGFSSMEASRPPVRSQLEQEDAQPTDADLTRSLVRLRTTVIRAAVVGLVLRGGLTSVSWLLTKRRHRQRVLTLGDAVREAVSFSIFLGTLGGTYVACDEGLAAAFGKKRTSKWRALVAGAVAGQALRLAGRSKDRHYSLATYVLLRGLVLLVRCGNKSQTSPLLRALLAPTRYEHGDVALMCVAASQIVYSFIMMPSTLPTSYVRFLNKQANKELWVWRAVQEQALRNRMGLKPAPLRTLKGTEWEGHASRTPCEFWHPGQTCTQHAASILPSAYVRALSVYVPVYLVPSLLVHRQKLVQKPLAIWPKLALGVSRSSLFLALYIAVGMGAVCAGFNVAGINTGPVIASSVWVAGLATLVEKKSRRMELALYCLSRSIESFARCLQEWGVAPTVQGRVDVLLFSAACASIMHCYSDSQGVHRDVFRSKYLTVLDALFGGSGVDSGCIIHKPSNLELVNTVHQRIRSMSYGRLHDASALHHGAHSTSELSSHRHQDYHHSASVSGFGTPAGPSFAFPSLQGPAPGSRLGPHHHQHQHQHQHGQNEVVLHTPGWMRPGAPALHGQPTSRLAGGTSPGGGASSSAGRAEGERTARVHASSGPGGASAVAAAPAFKSTYRLAWGPAPRRSSSAGTPEGAPSASSSAAAAAATAPQHSSMEPSFKGITRWFTASDPKAAAQVQPTLSARLRPSASADWESSEHVHKGLHEERVHDGLPSYPAPARAAAVQGTRRVCSDLDQHLRAKFAAHELDAEPPSASADRSREHGHVHGGDGSLAAALRLPLDGSPTPGGPELTVHDGVRAAGELPAGAGAGSGSASSRATGSSGGGAAGRISFEMV